MNFKWLTVPWSNATRKIEVPQTWEVRWKSRQREIYDDRPEVEVFLSREEAAAFAESLVNAFSLLRHRWGISVSVNKSK